ncbi:tryptophan synthase [Aspergillus lentulus]|uniref:tryptophan synthase n=1 Tax=Aspergillus lentulus TaxID=293939 RepID=A0AAN4PAH1_ASPLE|nr:tryptophan synthase [Aspergillus lentulus]
MIIPTSFKPSLTRIRSKRRNKRVKNGDTHSMCPACLYHLSIIQGRTAVPSTLLLHDVQLATPLESDRLINGETLDNTAAWETSPLPSLPILLSPTRFGTFGGRFAPESQMDALQELTLAFDRLISDYGFWKEFLSFPGIRPSPLRFAENLTRIAGGANIWLKREDLNQHGSHNIRSIVGQALLARRLGKTEVVMECGSARHGIVCAATCARLNMKCTILMGSRDATNQKDSVDMIRKLGATVLTADMGAPSGRGTLRAAVNEALRYSVAHLSTTYHIMSGPIGPHPLPTITRTFQSILGEEIKTQFGSASGDRLPDALVSPIGPGSAAVGMFYPFIEHPSVKLLGIEAADAAPLSNGDLGVLHGCRTYLLQDEHGQILDSSSISPDLDFPSVGPELAHWKETARVEYVAVTDAEALRGADILRSQEGIVSAAMTGYAVERTIRLARELGPGKDVVLLVAG